MRLHTPRATPVLLPSAGVEAPTRERSPVERELVPPVAVVTPWGAMELEHGSLLIGRLPECDICVADELLSRMHARISVQERSIIVEDLHSTNGVYVNGARIRQEVVACEGDRVLVGSSELVLLRLDAAGARDPGDELAPTSAVVPAVATALELVPFTAKVDALTMIGGLADRLADSGHVQGAVEVLSEHLNRMQRGVSSGLSMPPLQVVAASRYALRLASWTGKAAWIDYVVELHLATTTVMSEATLAVFTEVCDVLDAFDRSLLSYYVDEVRRKGSALTLPERERLADLLALARY
jgi:pSer/pThr/pTyr-binding forkhead associated (FHA) protein